MATRLMTMWATLLVLGVGGSALGQSAPTTTKPPRNDEPAAAKGIRRLPFATTEDVTNATVGADEPAPSCVSPPVTGQTVWFQFTPKSDGIIEADTQGSSANGIGLDTVLGVYTFDGTHYTEVACSDEASNVDFNDPHASQIWLLPATAGTTYYFQVGTFGNGYTAADLHFNVNAAANDEFTSAQNIRRVPSTFSENATAATTSVGEPIPTCVSNAGATISQTVWFTYTASASASLEADTAGSFLSGQTTDQYDTVMGVYTYDGNSFTQVTCSDDSAVDPNNSVASQVFWTNGPSVTTYYIQVGSYNGNQYGGAQLNLNINKGP